MPQPAERVDKVLVSVPAAPLRPMSDRPGDEGLLVEVFFSRSDQPGGVAVRGSLEIQIFQGAVSDRDVLQKKPQRVETYPNSELRKPRNVEGTGPFGVSYRFLVPLGPELSADKKITVVGRYVSPSGASVVSEPTTVPLRPS
jgi:hypothetical protein